MNAAGHIKPWAGHAFRQIPDSDNNNPLDFGHCALSSTNRWNVKGESTIYLACDKAVAIGEFARHLEDTRTNGLVSLIRRRRIWRFELQLNKTLDLCDPKVTSALSLKDAPNCFKDKSIARSTATFLRSSLKVEAIFVSSMVFIDDLSKWCLVLFLENLPDDLELFLLQVQNNGHIEMS